MGVLILDASCYNALKSPACMARFMGNIRVAQLTPWVSALNLVELCRNLNASARAELLTVVSAVSRSRPVLPLPYDLLRRIGLAILRGEPGFATDATGLEWVLRRSEGLTQEQIDAAIHYTDDMEKRFAVLHERARALLRPRAKKAGMGNSPGELVEFLNDRWTTRENLEGQIRNLWKRLKLPDEPPIDMVLANEAFRLFFEGLGVSAFERAVAANPPKQVHLADILQLVYLAGSHARIIASADNGLLRAAGAVLHGRYPNARTLHIAQLLE